MTGRHLGSSYELIEPIGSGSMGEVWRGRSLLDDTAVAVKVLRAELCGDDEVVGRFVQERHLLVGLRHPNLVAVMDLVADADDLAIVMELVEGPTLTGLRQASPTATLAPALAFELCAQVLRGLEAVHAAGIVHRDVKADNVVVAGPAGAPVAKVADFGVARMVAGARLTRITSLIGTPEYLAPEIIAGADATPAGDIYAVGVVAYELLFARTPFGGGSADEVLEAHRSQAPPRPDGVADQAWTALARMLDKDPARRPDATTAAAVMAAAAPALAGVAPFASQGAPADDHPGASGDTPLGAGHHPAGATVVRARPGAGQAAGPAAAPAAATPTRRRGRRRLALGVGGAMAMAVAAVAAWPGQGSAQAPSTYSFVPALLPNGVAVARTWQLRDGGRSFHGELRLTNTSDVAVSDSFEETIPKSLAASVDDISFSPAVDAVVKRDPVVRYDLDALAPAGVARFRYDIEVDEGGDAFARLKAWADDHARTTGAVAGVRLTALSVSPGEVTLAPAQRFPLRVRGTMSDDTRAPPAVLGGLAWSAGDPAVVTVTNGALTAVGPGTTEITAQAGPLVAKVTVSVTGPEVAGGPTTSAGAAAGPGTGRNPRPTGAAVTTAPRTATTVRGTPTTVRGTPTTAGTGGPTTAGTATPATTSAASSPPGTTPATAPPTTRPVVTPRHDAKTIGVFYKGQGRWNLRRSNTAGGPDIDFVFGNPDTTLPLVGDWNGDGVDTIGVYYPSEGRWNLRNANSSGGVDANFVYGNPGTAVPVVGDWNGDGVDTIGAYYPSEGRWNLRNANSSGGADANFVYGNPGTAVPVVGDWNGDGVDTIGVYYPSEGRWNLRNANTSGGADANFVFGNPGTAAPVVGDWNADGVDTIGAFYSGEGRWNLRNANTNGGVDIDIFYGAANSATAVVGDWS